MKYVLAFAAFFLLAADIPLAARLKKATADYENGHYDQVISSLNPYADELPAPGAMMLASSYSKKHRYEDEVRVLKAYTVRDEKNDEIQMLLAQAYLKQEMDIKDKTEQKKIETQAITALHQCLKLRPKFKPAFDLLLSILIEQNDIKDGAEARDVLQDGLEKFGHRPELMKEACRLDALEGYVDQALQSCQEAIRLAPQYPDNYVYLTQSFFDQNEKSSAEQTIVKAAGRFPASEFVQWSAGTLFFKQKDYPVSSRFFAQAVKADPSSSRSEFGYAQALFESGQTKEALPVFIKACQLDPKNVTEIFFSASSRLRQKDDPLGERYKEAANGCHTR